MCIWRRGMLGGVGKATKEMLKDFIKAVKAKTDETQNEEIYAKFFIEYM
jgi:aspartate/glutamate racemase